MWLLNGGMGMRAINEKSGKKVKRKSKLSRTQKIVLGIGIFFIAMALAATGLYLHVYNKIYVSDDDSTYGDNVDYSNLELEEPLYKEVKGITNILLIGIDARESNEASRSDAMIILTIDSNNEKVKLTSIMRDSYVDIPTYKTAKINAAFAKGGPQLLMKTIEANFRLKLEKYIIVDFHGFEDIVDAVGGIEVDVSESERKELNKYIGETREVKSPALTKSGYQKLDGQQALAYARIRYNDSDYRRTERQREVLSILANKLLKTSVVNYPKVMNSILDCVTTNIKPEMLLNYAYTVSKFDNMKIEQLQIPMTELSWGGYYKGEWLLLLDKDQNATVMNDFIFTDKEPNVDELDMDAFNAVIEGYLGRSVVNKNTSKSSTSKSSSKSVNTTTTNKNSTTSSTSNTSNNSKKYDSSVDKAGTSINTKNENTYNNSTATGGNGTTSIKEKDNTTIGSEAVNPNSQSSTTESSNESSNMQSEANREKEQIENKDGGQVPLS